MPLCCRPGNKEVKVDYKKPFSKSLSMGALLGLPLVDSYLKRSHDKIAELSCVPEVAKGFLPCDATSQWSENCL